MLQTEVIYFVSKVYSFNNDYHLNKAILITYDIKP